MTKKTESLLPLSLARARRRFEAWRLRKRPGARIPEALRAKAVEAAREHGLARTSQALRLDYYTLKGRMEKAYSPLAPPTPNPPSRRWWPPFFPLLPNASSKWKPRTAPAAGHISRATPFPPSAPWPGPSWKEPRHAPGDSPLATLFITTLHRQDIT